MINVSLFLRSQKYNYVLHILYKLSCQKYALIVLWYVFKMIQYLRQIELRVLNYMEKKKEIYYQIFNPKLHR